MKNIKKFTGSEPTQPDHMENPEYEWVDAKKQGEKIIYILD